MFQYVLYTYEYECYMIITGNIPQLHISYKPQKISPKSQGIVRQLLHEKIRDAYVHPQVSTFPVFYL